MEPSTDDRDRCAATVAALSVELAWDLGADQQQSYVLALIQYLPVSYSETELQRRVLNYHQDHQVIHTLRDTASPQYETIWKHWCSQTTRILRSRGFSSDDALAEIEDLTQIALEELIQAIPTFQYASRFSTWAYSVISHSAQHYLRARAAAKRRGSTESIEHHMGLEIAAPEDEHPVSQAQAHALIALIDSALTKQSDSRLAEIFRLWAIEDQRLVDIAQCVGLSPSRTSVLIGQACRVLQENPDILAWLGSSESKEIERSVSQDSVCTKEDPNRYI